MRPILCLLFFFALFDARGQTGTPKRKGNYETEFKMKEGSYLGFGQVNLSLGEIGFKVEVYCPQKNALLEFRIDKPHGKKSRKIGSLKIPNTGDTTYALKFTGDPRYSNGVHDLFLVARGSTEFSITSFSFIMDY